MRNWIAHWLRRLATRLDGDKYVHNPKGTLSINVPASEQVRVTVLGGGGGAGYRVSDVTVSGGGGGARGVHPKLIEFDEDTVTVLGTKTGRIPACNCRPAGSTQRVVDGGHLPMCPRAVPGLIRPVDYQPPLETE